MVETQINLFDAVVIGVIGLSALLSFFRGFIREVLSLGAWVSASLITIYAFPKVAGWLQPSINNTAIASGFAALGTFMTALVLISIINGILLKYMKKGSEVGLLDNWLGLLFGIFRGSLILALGFYIMTLVLKPDDYPIWVQEAMTRDYVEKGASILANLAPEYLKPMSPLTPEEADALTTNDPIPGGDSDDDTQGEDAGYNWMNVQELERLIESSQENADHE